MEMSTIHWSFDFMADKLSAPTASTVKRLFAVSGNQCAFPKCTQTLVEGKTVTGKICHIKGNKQGSARHDETQPDQERHGFENLILMCGKHHDVIDDDEDAYTVDRLVRMKADHERTAIRIPDEQAERAAGLILNQQVTSMQQSGGITAHTVHVLHYAERSAESESANETSDAIVPKVGNGRFRAQDESIGFYWNTIPFAKDPGLEIFLNDGPVLCIRMRSADGSRHDFDNDALMRCVQIPNVPLQPLSWGNMHYLRAVDGVGTYGTDDPANRSTTSSSICFAFSKGEIWAADTSLLSYSQQKLYFVDIVRAIAPRFRGYAEFLSCLGLTGPFEWSVGIDDVRNRVLQVPPPPNHISTSSGHRCMQDSVIAKGTYELGDVVPQTLKPFFNQLFRACGTSIPNHIDQIIQDSGIR
jgi:hypothetical protein